MSNLTLNPEQLSTVNIIAKALTSLICCVGQTKNKIRNLVDKSSNPLQDKLFCRSINVPTAVHSFKAVLH